MGTVCEVGKQANARLYEFVQVKKVAYDVNQSYGLLYVNVTSRGFGQAYQKTARMPEQWEAFSTVPWCTGISTCGLR